MANATGTYPTAPTGAQPQRIAWGVLLLAFAGFCILCLFVGLGVQYFFFQSTIPMPSMLVVSRGTAGLTEADLVEQVVRRGREIYNRARISTDGVSQATISFVDRYQNGTLVASVTLRSNSSVDLEQVERPRFNWSSEGYRIDLGDVTGDLSVRINPEIGRGARITLKTPQGARLILDRAGRYSVTAGVEQLQIINYEGAATLITPAQIERPIPIGERSVMQYNGEQIQMMRGYIDLLPGDSFSQSNVVDMTGTVATTERSVWRCRSTQLGLPAGLFDLVNVDGRSALRFWRGGGADSHGETFCVQNLGMTAQSGLDVSMYDYLAWRATFKIVGQSLGTCGVDGSECPMTLRMDYIPVVGEPVGEPESWYHGFYVFPSTQGEFPPRCNTCAQDHDIINDNAWYTYDSGNLLALIPPDLRPKAILNIRFYASGHEYDVYVQDVSMMAGQGTSVTPPTGTTG